MASTPERVALRSSPRRPTADQQASNPVAGDDESGDKKMRRRNSFSKDEDRPLRPWLPLIHLFHRLKNTQGSAKSLWVLILLNVFIYVSLSHKRTPDGDYPLFEQTTHSVKSKPLAGDEEKPKGSVRGFNKSTAFSPTETPRAVHIMDDYLTTIERLPLTLNATDLEHREVPYRKHTPKRYHQLDRFPKKGCQIMGGWQVSHRPTCSLLHEIDLTQRPYCDRHLNNTYRHESSYPVGTNGLYRTTWMARNFDGSKVALKTMVLDYDQSDPMHFDRHRIDAIAMEQLTSSPYVLSVHAHCGNSVVTEFADGGELYSFVRRAHEPRDLVKLSLHLATSLAHLHHYNDRGHATIAHADLHSGNWMNVKGVYKINDFNRAQFLTWNKTKDEQCTFLGEDNKGLFRPPEEYNKEPLTEKVDIFAIGYLLRGALEGKWPSADYSKEDWFKLVSHGGYPEIDAAIRNSTNVYTRAVVKVVDLALKSDPNERPSAKDLTRILKAALSKEKRTI